MNSSVMAKSTCESDLGQSKATRDFLRSSSSHSIPSNSKADGDFDASVTSPSKSNDFSASQASSTSFRGSDSADSTSHSHDYLASTELLSASRSKVRDFQEDGATRKRSATSSVEQNVHSEAIEAESAAEVPGEQTELSSIYRRPSSSRERRVPASPVRSYLRMVLSVVLILAKRGVTMCENHATYLEETHIETISR